MLDVPRLKGNVPEFLIYLANLYCSIKVKFKKRLGGFIESKLPPKLLTSGMNWLSVGGGGS